MSASTAVSLPLPAARPRFRSLRRFARHRLAVFGLVAIIVLVLACAFGPPLLPYNDIHIDLRHRSPGRMCSAATSSAATCSPGC
jgi:peptide/nickel transport system permease protein